MIYFIKKAFISQLETAKNENSIGNIKIAEEIENEVLSIHNLNIKNGIYNSEFELNEIEYILKKYGLVDSKVELDKKEFQEILETLNELYTASTHFWLNSPTIETENAFKILKKYGLCK